MVRSTGAVHKPVPLAGPPWDGAKVGPPSHQPGLSPRETHPLSLLQFSQQEEKRQKSERLQQQQKHENQMRDMLAQCESNMSELQQLQVRPAASLPDGLRVPKAGISGPESPQTGTGSRQTRPRWAGFSPAVTGC